MRSALVALMLLSIAARALFVFIAPVDGWSPDSAVHGIMAKEVAAGAIPVYDYYIVGYYRWVPPFFHLVAAAFYALAPLLVSLEFASVIAGILSVPLCYLTFKRIATKQTALLASFFLAVYPTFLRLGVSVMVDALVVLLSLLALYALAALEKDKNMKNYALLAVSLGLLLLTKYTGFAVAGVVTLWLLATRRMTKLYAAAIIAGILLAAPWYAHNYYYGSSVFAWPGNLKPDATLSERAETLWYEVTNNLDELYTRFWDAVPPVKIGAAVPGWAGVAIYAYLLLGIPYIAFFAVGVSRKNDWDKLMLLWLLAYVAFAVYFVTTGWDFGYATRTALFGLPALCYVFANGFQKVSQRFSRHGGVLVAFLLISGIVFIGFEAYKLSVKGAYESRLWNGYDWVKENVEADALIVTDHVEMSLFTDRKVSQQLPSDLSNYKNVYMYAIKTSLYKLSQPKEPPYVKLYDDGIVAVYRIKK